MVPVHLPPAAPPAEPAKRTHHLQRTTFQTSRLLDFCSRKELIAQTGHQPEDWPLVVLKELVDNALDACEEAGIAPEIAVSVDETASPSPTTAPACRPTSSATFSISASASVPAKPTSRPVAARRATP